MRWADIPRDPSTTTLRQFGLLAVLILGGLSVWRIVGHAPSPGSIGLGVFGLILGVLGVLAPRLLKPIFVGWLILAFPIGWLVSQVVMVGMYYGVLTPLGLALRATGRDPLALKRSDQSPDSYWQSKPAPDDPRRYFRQY